MNGQPLDENVQELVSMIKRRIELYRKALELRQKVFNEHFLKLPDELRKRFLSLVGCFENLREENEGNQGVDSELKNYYRKAALRFHPDRLRNGSKVTLFLEARNAYKKKDLLALKALVLVDMVNEFEQLSEDERRFLFSQVRAMEEVAEEILEKGANIALETARLEGMSDNMFQLEIEEVCKAMEEEIKNGGKPEGQMRPALIERR